MTGSKQKFEPWAPLFSAALARFFFLRGRCRLIFCLLAFLFPVVAAVGDAYDATLDRRFETTSNANNAAPAVPTDPHLAAIQRELKAEQRIRSQGPEAAPAAAPVDKDDLIMLLASLLAAALAFLAFVTVLNRQLRRGVLLSQEAMDRMLKEKLITEQPSLVAFFNELRYGLGTSDNPDANAATRSETPMSKKEQAEGLQEFFETAPGRIAALRAQFSKISRAPDKAARVELLRDFFCQIDVLKQQSKIPALRPIWLMTCGLQGLLQQLAMTATSVNPSVLRTAAGAVDLLEMLSVPGLDPDLAVRTPVQLLAVDDNAVCLAAVSLALKKAFREPDLAASGAPGLDLAEKKNYDVIFLDVEMPGMDGFELCSRIRQTSLNRNTPVVFVTSHSDFGSRAKSTLVGGQDLIAKPFLSFEITVKALTLTLRGRLQNNAAESQPAAKETCEAAA